MKHSTTFFLILSLLFSITIFAQEGSRSGQTSPEMPQPQVATTDNAVIYLDNMDGLNDTTSLKARGYLPYYRGTGPQGSTATWFQGNSSVFASYNGPGDGYVAANYNAVTSVNNIDNWLVFPALDLMAGDTLYFWERGPAASTYPDSIRVMYSQSSTTPEGTWTELGRFKTTITGSWNRRAFVLPFSSPVGRLAIRYCVVSGGPSGSNSDYVGLDAISVVRAGGSGPMVYSGEWCTGFPVLPNAAMYTASAWVGDTLYLHLPTTTGAATNAIFKYTWGGTWTAGTALPAAMVGGSLVECANKLYMVGGSATGISTSGSTLYEYSPSTGMWTSKAAMPVGLAGHRAVAWGDSVIFVIGGPWTGSLTNLNVHYYRPGSDSWGTLTNSLPAGMGRRTFAAGISGNKIVVSSGFNTAFLKTTLVGTLGSDATSLTWAMAPDVNIDYNGLSRPGGIAYGDYMFVVGGERGGPGGYCDSTFVFSIADNAWVFTIPGKPMATSNIWNTVSAKVINDTVRLFAPGAYNVSAKDNFDVLGCGLLVIPVELASFTASVGENSVQLNWTTATETNNFGFEVQRAITGSEFEKVGFIPGYGTTTERKSYSFNDANLAVGNYTYRLIQIDLDGTRYTVGTIEAEVTFVPQKYALFQNYPNPFNPSTTIKYQLPEKSQVTLRIYDVLGNLITSLVNTEQNAGSYEVVLDASDYSSGVYLYTITAGKFTDSKKLILIK